MCNLVEIINHKTVKIIEYPTLKINSHYRSVIEELYKNFKQNNVILLYI